MIDARSDRATELSDRQRAAADAKRAFQARPRDAAPARRGRLSAEEAAARKEAQAAETGILSVGGGAAGSVRQVPRGAPPADPDAAFRTGVRGVLAAVVLVLIFLWARQRRRSAK